MRIVIVGAGPGGLCTAILLKQAGYDDFVLLEQSDGVGGTWRHNRYPGCACDLPSALYSFSFEIKSDWTRPYATQPEILAYLESVARRCGILPHCRFRTRVEGAAWDEERALWRVELEHREVLEAQVLISAIGMFNELAWPDLPGLDGFAGTLLHSARWPENCDLSGIRVGVIGSAASAVQLVPEVAKTSEQVHLFQRTANWVLPKEDDPYTESQLEHFRRDPGLVRAIRQQIFDEVDRIMTFSDAEAIAEREAAVLSAIEVVEDRSVRAKLVPKHPFGCKRPLFSNDYYPAFNRSNLELVTEAIDRVDAGAIVTEDGRERPVDALVLATGFETTRFVSALDVRGRGGRPIAEAWKEGARAYLGIVTAGFPNLFMLYGPNTNNGSIIAMLEAQAGWILSQVERLEREGLAWMEVRAEPMERYDEEIQRAIDGITVWQASCNGYYRSSSGRIVTQWPYSMSEYRARTVGSDPGIFEVAVG